MMADRAQHRAIRDRKTRSRQILADVGVLKQRRVPHDLRFSRHGDAMAVGIGRHLGEVEAPAGVVEQSRSSRPLGIEPMALGQLKGESGYRQGMPITLRTQRAEKLPAPRDAVEAVEFDEAHYPGWHPRAQLHPRDQPGPNACGGYIGENARKRPVRRRAFRDGGNSGSSADDPAAAAAQFGNAFPSRQRRKGVAAEKKVEFGVGVPPTKMTQGFEGEAPILAIEFEALDTRAS